MLAEVVALNIKKTLEMIKPKQVFIKICYLLEVNRTCVFKKVIFNLDKKMMNCNFS